MRHPNSYLPKYNIQSETDGESVPLTHSNDVLANMKMLKNGVDIGPHQIIQSDEDDDDDEVQAYGFPSQKRRNRVQQSDLELELSKGGEFKKLSRSPDFSSIFLFLPFRSFSVAYRWKQLTPRSY